MNSLAFKAQHDGAPDPAGMCKPTLLLVDDEERVLRSLRMLFARDYNVMLTTDPYAAIRTLKQQAIDVLISDQRMPEMEGVELLKLARECSPRTMRILLTGYADLAAMVGSINEGEVFRFINKPWNAEELRMIVATAAQIARQSSAEAVPISTASRAAPAASHTPAMPVQSVPSPAPAPPQAFAGVVLVVDADKGVVTELAGIVRECFGSGCRVIGAHSLDSALKSIESYDVSLIISDVSLSGEDIRPLIAALKAGKPEVVTIVVAAFQSAGILSQLINQGQIFRYLSKPIRHALVRRAIEGGMERHLILRQQPDMQKRYQVEVPTAGENQELLGKLKSFLSRFGK